MFSFFIDRWLAQANHRRVSDAARPTMRPTSDPVLPNMRYASLCKSGTVSLPSTRNVVTRCISEPSALDDLPSDRAGMNGTTGNDRSFATMVYGQLTQMSCPLFCGFAFQKYPFQDEYSITRNGESIGSGNIYYPYGTQTSGNVVPVKGEKAFTYSALFTSRDDYYYTAVIDPQRIMIRQAIFWKKKANISPSNNNVSRRDPRSLRYSIGCATTSNSRWQADLPLLPSAV